MYHIMRYTIIVSTFFLLLCSSRMPSLFIVLITRTTIPGITRIYSHLVVRSPDPDLTQRRMTKKRGTEHSLQNCLQKQINICRNYNQVTLRH